MAKVSLSVELEAKAYPPLAPAVSATDKLQQFSLYGDSSDFSIAVVNSSAILQWDDRGRLTKLNHEISGCGTDYGRPEMATTRAVSEMLERQAGFLRSNLDIVRAARRDLGDRAIPLARLPRCSQLEYADPRCGLSEPDEDDVLDWVMARSLSTGERTLVPVEMVLLGDRHGHAAKQLVAPISTGYAAHVCAADALLAGLLEVIERDAIALTWECRLPLPRLDPGLLSEQARRLLDDDARRGIDNHLFDASTDIDGVSIVYCVQRDHANRRLRQSVHCAAALDPVTAADKVLREAAASRSAIMQAAKDTPIGTPAQISAVVDGAVYMGVAERESAFEFLLAERPAPAPAPMPRRGLEESGSSDQLDSLVRRLTERGHEVLAIDLTTRSAAAHGIVVVRVIVLGLVPMSISPYARYRGEPRMYEYPLHKFGMEIDEGGLNPWPQPFA
jgi:ribosomal protein S12 methylthiotransferase accessory factor